MPSPLEVHDWHELDVTAADGEHIGKLVDAYVNDTSGEPEFLLVSSGVLGHRLHLAPAEGATRTGDEVRLAVSREAVEAAPHIHADNDLTPDEEKRLFEHYGMSHEPHPGGLLIIRRWVLLDRG